MISIIQEYFFYFIDLFLHLDIRLQEIITDYGSLTYLILFLVIFCETGLVVTPFLPGDSLLFAAGAFSASGSLDVGWLFMLLIIAAILGDAVNYLIGKKMGPRALQLNTRFFKHEYIARTEKFYEKYGSKTIVIARFVPIVRTFAPFLAGIGKMNYSKFGYYNISGALLWVSICLFAGYFFGNLEIVRKNFTLVILAIIFISVLPALIEIYRERKK